MPSIDTTNNSHPLAGDFSMYYRGTYMSRFDAKGNLWVMYVRGVEAESDGVHLEDLDFIGDVFGASGRFIGDGELQRWSADTISYKMPRLGYRMVGKTPVYFSTQVSNRTQKKGLFLESVITNPRINLNKVAIYALFADAPFEGKHSRDLVSHGDSLLWQGETIGSFSAGDLILNKTHEYLKEFVCKLLERSSEVKTVNVSDQ